MLKNALEILTLAIKEYGCEEVQIRFKLLAIQWSKGTFKG